MSIWPHLSQNRPPHLSNHQLKFQSTWIQNSSNFNQTIISINLSQRTLVFLEGHQHDSNNSNMAQRLHMSLKESKWSIKGSKCLKNYECEHKGLLHQIKCLKPSNSITFKCLHHIPKQLHHNSCLRPRWRDQASVVHPIHIKATKSNPSYPWGSFNLPQCQLNRAEPSIHNLQFKTWWRCFDAQKSRKIFHL